MRILVLTDDRLGPTMAGSAVRAWELASALHGSGHAVRLVAGPGSEVPSAEGPYLEHRPPWRWAEVVLSPAWCVPARAFVGSHLLIADGVTPLLAELDALPATPEVVRRRRTSRARLQLVASRADAILAAGPAQVEWWSEQLPDRFGLPLLNVPFGIPDRPPSHERDQIPGVPDDWAVVLWWGGVWPWLDLDTLLAARARLAAAPVSVVVPTADRPGGSASRFATTDLVAAAGRYGLTAPQVVALERWVPYRERHRILNRCTLLAVLHRSSDEAALSYRTRVMDGVWAGVPLLLSEGGEAARLAREHGWGGVVPPGNVRATAATLELMLGERAQARCRATLATGRDRWTWSSAVKPLERTLPTLPAVRRGSLATATARAVLRLVRRSTTEAR